MQNRANDWNRSGEGSADAHRRKEYLRGCVLQQEL